VCFNDQQTTFSFGSTSFLSDGNVLKLTVKDWINKKQGSSFQKGEILNLKALKNAKRHFKYYSLTCWMQISFWKRGHLVKLKLAVHIFEFE
jgi:hypothetical protein